MNRSGPVLPRGWMAGKLDGVARRSIAFHPDARGSFGELWRDSWTSPLGAPMQQANLSRSDAGVLRGLHLHQRQADLWVLADGRAFIGLVDVRPRLAGSGPAIIETIEASAGDAVYLPAGVAHGFYAQDPITLIYLVTNQYDGSDELGFAWNDPEVGVPWPDREPTLSERDASAPSLRELLAKRGL